MAERMRERRAAQWLGRLLLTFSLLTIWNLPAAAVPGICPSGYECAAQITGNAPYNYLYGDPSSSVPFQYATGLAECQRHIGTAPLAQWNIFTIAVDARWNGAGYPCSVMYQGMQNTGFSYIGEYPYQAGCSLVGGTASGTDPNKICVGAMACPDSTYTYNPASQLCERPITCISPDAIDPATGQCVHCPISDLPPITDPEVQAFEDNSDLSDTARLTNEMQAALQRLVTAASAAGGDPTVGSAYRPPAYNQHLIDVWEKYMGFLRSADNPEVTSNVSCMLVLWPKIQRHFRKHGLLVTQSPVPNSRHTRGLAVDVTINLPSANIDALAAGAGLRRPLPVTDPVHFQFP